MFTTPAVAGDALYVGSCSGVFYALDARGGEVRWTYDTRGDGDPAQFHGNPVITGDLVVTPSDSTPEGFTYAFDRADGAVRWKQPTGGGGGIETDLLRTGDTVIGVTKSGDLVSLDLTSGFPLWSFSPESYEYGSFRPPNPAVAGDRVLFGGADGAVYGVDAGSGRKLWKVDLGARISTGLAAYGEDVYLGLEDHRLVRMTVADGTVAGVLPLDGQPVGYPLVTGENVFVLLGNDGGASELLALDAALDGDRWRALTGDAWTTVRPMLWQGKVLAGTDKGELLAFAAAGGELDWQLGLEGRLRGLGSAGDLLFVGTIDGTLYAVDTTGARTFPDPPDTPALFATGRRAIEAAHAAYGAAWRVNDRAAVLATLTPDVVLMPSGTAPIEGLAAAQAFWWPDDGSKTTITAYESTIEEVRDSGDVAAVRARSSMSFTSEKGGEVSEHTTSSMSLSVLERGDDGRWRIAVRMWGRRTD